MLRTPHRKNGPFDPKESSVSPEALPATGDAELATEPHAELLEALAADVAGLVKNLQKTEADLHLRDALLHLQSDLMIDAMLAFDNDGKVISFNHRLLEILDLEEEQVTGCTVDELFAVLRKEMIDEEGARKRLAEIVADPERESRAEIEFRNGKVIERWSAPLRDVDGVIRGRGWFFRDISSQRAAEQLLEDNRSRASLLSEAGAVLTSSMDYRALVTSVAALCAEWFCDWAAIDLLDRDGSIDRVAIANRRPEEAARVAEVDSLRRYPSDPAASVGVRRVIASGKWEMQDAIKDEWLQRESNGDEAYLGVLRSLNLRSSLCVPLQIGTRTLGAMTFVTTNNGRHFGPADLATAQELAYRVASAVEHARLFEEHVHISRTLQRSLLPPHLPEIPRLELAARYSAAGEGYQVGGDFYDAFRTGKNDWAVLIGDVCGKGAEAAATTALARYTLRAAAMQSRKPSVALSTLNQAMLRTEAQTFCTVAYARIRPADEGIRLTIACGGHPLPLLVHADGTVQTAGRSGTLLGCFQEPALNEAVITLGEGDSLVLYTDGVTEARDGLNVFGEERFHEILRGIAGLSAAEMAEAIERAALDFQVGDARDDIAVVVLKASD
jgi:PAS domain S-box-containing protein